MADDRRAIGIVGRPIVGWVNSHGGVNFADGSANLDWFVAADDRWYDPSREVAVRQNDEHGLPVVTTRLRVPGGDIVHTAWCVAGPDARPIVVVDILNDSPMPVAVALSRTDLSVSRPVAARGAESAWPAPGLDLPEAPTVMPIGHRASIRVCVGRDLDLSKMPERDAVVRGWTTMCEQSSRFVLPDQVGGRLLTDRIDRAKSDIILNLRDNDAPWRDADALARWLLARFHAHRMGAGSTEPDDVAAAVERIIARSKRSGLDCVRSAAVRSGAIWLSSESPRVVDDIDRLASRKLGQSAHDIFTSPRIEVRSDTDGPELITAVEDSLAVWMGGDVLSLCSDGVSSERLGSSFEAHGLAAPGSTKVSLAVRWHGANAAVLWQIDGDRRFTLTSGVDRDWSNAMAAGDALWRTGFPMSNEASNLEPMTTTPGDAVDSPSFS